MLRGSLLRLRRPSSQSPPLPRRRTLQPPRQPRRIPSTSALSRRLQSRSACLTSFADLKFFLAVCSQPKEVFPVYVWAYMPQDRKEMLKQAMKTAAKKEV